MSKLKSAQIVRARGLLSSHNSNHLLNSPQPPTADPSLVTLTSGDSAASPAHSPLAQAACDRQDAADPGCLPPTK